MKAGDYVIAVDGFDMAPRIRVVMEATKNGCICRTAESDLGLVFRSSDVRLATKDEYKNWQQQNIAFILED